MTKTLVTLSRVLVGLVFIFSGLVKANDPLGLSYKMQEFFEVWGLHGWNGITLTLSVLMNAFEIVAGIALLLGWGFRFFGWCLIWLILFFTFLTGYTYMTGKPANCGCFGDCLPISSGMSFFKDLLLLILILFIKLKQTHIRPLLPLRAGRIAMLLAVGFSFGFQYYTLRHLPVVDCLPFRKGNDIAEKMKRPANAVPDSTVITFVYSKNGQEVEFTADQFPADFNATTYQFVRRYDRIVRKGRNNEPPIRGFVLSGESNQDSTAFVLSQPYALLFFVEKPDAAGKNWAGQLRPLAEAAAQRRIPVYLVTAGLEQARRSLAENGLSYIQAFKCDYKAIQTAARHSLVGYLLEKGKVTAKHSRPDFSKLQQQLNAWPVQPAPVMSAPDGLQMP